MCPRDLRVSDVCRSSAGESLFHFAGRLLLRHRHSSCVLLLKIAHSGCMPGLFVPASALPWRGSQAGGPAGLGWAPESPAAQGSSTGRWGSKQLLAQEADAPIPQGPTSPPPWCQPLLHHGSQPPSPMLPAPLPNGANLPSLTGPSPPPPWWQLPSSMVPAPLPYRSKPPPPWVPTSVGRPLLSRCVSAPFLLLLLFSL